MLAGTAVAGGPGPAGPGIDAGRQSPRVRHARSTARARAGAWRGRRVGIGRRSRRCDAHARSRRCVRVEVGGGYGLSGWQLSVMPQLTRDHGGGRRIHVMGAGVSIAFPDQPYEASGHPVWLNVDVFGYERHFDSGVSDRLRARRDDRPGRDDLHVDRQRMPAGGDGRCSGPLESAEHGLSCVLVLIVRTPGALPEPQWSAPYFQIRRNKSTPVALHRARLEPGDLRVPLVPASRPLSSHCARATASRPNAALVSSYLSRRASAGTLAWWCNRHPVSCLRRCSCLR